MALKLITPPASEPVSLVEAKAHLRVVGADDDALITSLISAARQSAESMTGRALMPQTWELALDEFGDEIRLPMPPLVSVTSVQYTDADGATQTLAISGYHVDDYSAPARLLPAYGTSWPATRAQANAIRIQYQAGYANSAAVPHEVKQWMLLRIGMLYENREETNVGNIVTEFKHVDRLLDPYRIWGL